MDGKRFFVSQVVRCHVIIEITSAYPHTSDIDFTNSDSYVIFNHRCNLFHRQGAVARRAVPEGDGEELAIGGRSLCCPDVWRVFNKVCGATDSVPHSGVEIAWIFCNVGFLKVR